MWADKVGYVANSLPEQVINPGNDGIPEADEMYPNYLGWRWIPDARRIISPESLLRATMGSFPHMMVT